MNPNDLKQLWQDALDDVPTEAVATALQLHSQQALQAKRRRRWLLRTGALVTVLGLAVTVFRHSLHQGEMALGPQPLPQTQDIAPPVPPRLTPSQPNPVSPTPLVAKPAPTDTAPAQNHIVIESVPLKEFLAQLPHHGYITIENDRGRFLVLVDNETGETFTTVLSEDDRL